MLKEAWKQMLILLYDVLEDPKMALKKKKLFTTKFNNEFELNLFNNNFL